ELSRIGREGENPGPAALAQRDQQHLIDVELAAAPPAARPVDRDRMLPVGERPAQLARVGPVGQPPCGAEELEDLLAAAVGARDGGRAGHLPDRVLGDHLEERARVAAAERVEDTADVADGVYCSSGAIVSPYSSSLAW